MKACHLRNKFTQPSISKQVGSSLLIFLIFILSFVGPENPIWAQGQSDIPSYWQYSASGRITQAQVADIDGNGIDEFIIGDENGRVELVDAGGTPRWRFVAPGAVTAITTLNAVDFDPFASEVLVGVPNMLVMLSSTGEEIWRTRVTPRNISPTIQPGEPPETAGEWEDSQDVLPVAISPYDYNSDGQAEILVLLQSGNLLLYDIEGEYLWQETNYGSNPDDVLPYLLVYDFDQDSRDEIVFSVFNPRRFGQVILIDDGKVQWEIPTSGRVTALSILPQDTEDPPQIAIGTSLGQVQLVEYSRLQNWLRTLNQPVSSLASIPIPQGNALAVGTSVGTVVAFDQEGRRLWENNLSDGTDREVLTISTSPAAMPPNQPSLAITIESVESGANTADLFLLDGAGRTVSKISDIDTLGLTRFVDSNRDHNNELIVGHFATLELLGLGVGNNENVREWEYTLDAVPSAVLVADFDNDGQEELIIGTENGRIHSLNNDRSLRWLHDVGGAITNLALLPREGQTDSDIIVIRQGAQGSGTVTETWMELREAKGENIWELELDSEVTALEVDISGGINNAIILIGLKDGRVVVYNGSGEKQSEFHLQELAGPVNRLALLLHEEPLHNEIIAAGDRDIVGIDPRNDFSAVRHIASFESRIRNLFTIQKTDNSELDVRLIVPTEDKTVHGLNWRGIEMAQWSWPLGLSGDPITSAANTDDIFIPQDQRSFLLGMDSGQLIQLDIEDNQPMVPWLLEGIGRITATYSRYHDGDRLPDLRLAGTNNGQVWLFPRSDTPDSKPMAAPLDLSSSVFALESIKRNDSQTPDLLAVTENGLIHLFREQENRPPYLSHPVAENDLGRYTVSVATRDVEQDDVTVQLEIQDLDSGEWIPLEPQTVANGNGTLFWTPPSTLAGSNGLNYRFVYNDGSNQGILMPPPGPQPTVSSSIDGMMLTILFVIGGISVIFGILFVRQSQTPNAQARRFHRRLKQHPELTLPLLEHQYIQSQGSPDFLLNLSNQASQAEDQYVANLAQGLFLLDNRPQSGLAILIRTLNEIELQEENAWESMKRWQLTFSTSKSLLDAPSITELSLLLPRLRQLLEFRAHQALTNLDLLRSVLTNLRDSDRVDLVEDRLVYLNEAMSQCQKIQVQLPDQTPSIEHTIVTSIIRRWTGLISAEIEDLRGRAQLIVSLKTKRVVPSESTDVALEIGNKGRSAAEDIMVNIDPDPAYIVLSSPKEIHTLPPGQSREVRFTIAPQVIDRFRISFTITFDDRNQREKEVAFGDMVHMLPPMRDFNPIPNPYTPGTPLRPDSTIFFGREDLFGYIAENAGYRSFRNVLILVGQRRTGKTSALLRLEDHLPRHLLPVYIDCQSLGVIAGMPALLEELAWTIADAMSRRGLSVDVPDLVDWQKDPTRLFQRRFLPRVKELLPSDTTLLLVFDEFEAFENLVADNILPPTFFTYLRHLMQHGEQLNFIFVGTRRLEEMSTDYWSVLFNIALYRKIDFLSVTAATRLIEEPVGPDLVYDDLAIDKILRVTAGHPYFLQLVCYTIVKQANARRTGYVTISDVNAAVDEMLSLGEVHFAYLWQRSSDTERALLTAVAHLMDQNEPFYPEELLEHLEPYYPQPNPAEVTRALNRLVERDILREVTQQVKTMYELKLGLVGSWVATNKSLSKLYAGNGSRRSELAVDETAG
ncbi:MAG: PQQ-binding-like beta-propeller repeat protein [Candidatus Promineifilaceae bacterium]|nr:PQQ-binding-like beta-propeller repeat protein [Candidatus Promineifilaceae bacterium]